MFHNANVTSKRQYISWKLAGHWSDQFMNNHQSRLIWPRQGTNWLSASLVENRLSLSASLLELLSVFIAPGSKGTITPGFSHQPGVKSHTQRPVHHARTFTPGWRHQPRVKVDFYSRLETPTGSRGGVNLYSRLVAPTGSKNGLPVWVFKHNRE
jgi:hypothetical protein